MAKELRLTCDIDSGDLAKFNEFMSPSKLTLLINRAGSQSATKIKSDISKKVSETYAVDSVDGNVQSSVSSGAGGAGLKLTYRGRVLTLKHFPFTGGQPIMATIFKGESRQVGTRNVFIPRGDMPQIPFYRKARSGGGWSLRSVHTLSVPQMIGGEKLSDKVKEEAQKLMAKELERIWNGNR